LYGRLDEAVGPGRSAELAGGSFARSSQATERFARQIPRWPLLASPSELQSRRREQHRMRQRILRYEPAKSVPRPPAERLTLSVDEAALLLGVSRQSAYAAARAGELPVLRLGRRILVVRKALDELLAGRRASR